MAELSTANQCIERINSTVSQNTDLITHSQSLHSMNYPQPVTTQSELPTASHYTDCITNSLSVHSMNYPQPVTTQSELHTANHYTDCITHSLSVHRLNYPQPFNTQTELSLSYYYIPTPQCAVKLPSIIKERWYKQLFKSVYILR